jgi:hypothetical protein
VYLTRPRRLFPGAYLLVVVACWYRGRAGELFCSAAEGAQRMIALVDGEVVAPDTLWWPVMNYNQFHWDHPLGEYELELLRAEYVERLTPAYRQCVTELRADDLLVPDQESPLKSADYPLLDALPDYPAAFFEAMRVYLWDDLFAAFLPCPPGAGRFMVNSIDTVSATPSVVVVRGRGYHAGPGLQRQAEPHAAPDAAT